MYNLKVLRSYKLQLSELGYIVNNGNIENVDFYRSLLRSGKQPKQKLYSSDRVFQYNRFLTSYLLNTSFSIHNYTYKEILKYCIYNYTSENNYTKCVISLYKLLIKLKMIEVYTICGNETIIKDNKHNELFMFKDNNFYRLVNNRMVNFKLK